MKIYSRDIYEVKQNGNTVKICAPCHYNKCVPVEDPLKRKACETVFTNKEGHHLGLCGCLGNHEISSHNVLMGNR